MKITAAVAAVILLFVIGTAAQTTNTLSDAEIQGRALAQKIVDGLNAPPSGGFTNTGVLEIRDAGGRKQIPLAFKILLTTTNWQGVYEAVTTNGIESLTTVHAPDHPLETAYHPSGSFSDFGGTSLSDRRFAGSDFSIGDLSLEFFHWPRQKVLKKEIHRSCGCTVLESTNPGPSTHGYSRVVSWIDNDTLGIVEAYAYDANGKQLKDFYPKDFKKVNGRWQVQTLVMENVQTRSRSQLKFDLQK